MKVSIGLVVLVLATTASASQSLLQALFDYADPLQLDENKSKRVAETWAKGKASKGSSKTKPNSMLEQFNYDAGDDYEYQDKIDKEYSDEAEPVNQQSQHTGGEIQEEKDKSKEQTEQSSESHKSNEQSQTSNKNDCPNDMPTYRMYSVLTGCGIPIDQEVVLPGSSSYEKPEAIKPEIEDAQPEETLAHYFHQVGQQGIGQHEAQKITEQHQEKSDLTEIVEEPFVQGSAADRILGQEGQNSEQETQHGYTSNEQTGQHDISDAIIDYDQIEPVSGQQEQNLGPSGRYEQFGQVEQQGQLSGILDESPEEFKETEQFFEDYDSKEYNQVGQQAQQVDGQQHVELPQLPERIPQQTRDDDDYHLRAQSGYGGGGSGRLQEQGPRHTYYSPGNVPKPAYTSSGHASVGTSYSGRGPVFNPHPNQIGNDEKFSCLGRSEGYYADYASDCRKFYRCAPGDKRVFEFSCGPGTKFDINTSQCGHAYEVHCDPLYSM